MTMSASLFQAMAMALIDKPKNINAGNIPEKLDLAREPLQVVTQPMDHLPQTSLVAADPTTFYTDVAFFDRLPARPSRSSCSLGIRCGHSTAVLFCHSCARFNDGHGHFCMGCFEAYHPWYRVTHKWSSIGFHPGEPSDDLDRQAYRASLARNIADIQGLLRNTSLWKSELSIQNTDTKAKDLIKVAVKKASRVAVRTRDLKYMGFKDCTQVSKVAVDEAMREAIRFQKKFEITEIDDMKDISMGWQKDSSN